MSPWMSSDTRPDPNRERCGNCGQPFEEHTPCECSESGCTIRLCADGSAYRPESDEDRKADWAGARGL